MITGPSNKSIGASAAISLAKTGAAQIILVGRSEARIKPVIEAIAAIDSSIQTAWVHADFLDNKTVIKAAEQIKGLTSKIDGLVNSAGIMAPQNFSTSVDGIEAQFASNHVGHFLLTNLLLPEVKAAKGIVVNVSSRGFELGGVRFDDINFKVSKYPKCSHN